MALGRWNEGRLLVLDVDGVLIDPCGSFERCAAMALADIVPGLPWSDELYWAFKKVPGFNNDFRLTAAAVALYELGEIKDGLHEHLKGGFAHLGQRAQKRIAELEPLCKERVQFHYQGVKHLERPLITLPELENIAGWDVAILTGRPPEELALAFDVLGFELPAACDTCPEFRKPEPGGLLHLAEAFGANEIFFVGDTMDDATCLRRARDAVRGHNLALKLVFVAVNKLRHKISQPGDLAYPTLRDFISSGALAKKAGQRLPQGSCQISG
jgi:phosphoglycolate phosphatase-like HAD superfamily hydrolase